MGSRDGRRDGGERERKRQRDRETETEEREGERKERETQSRAQRQVRRCHRRKLRMEASSAPG